MDGLRGIRVVDLGRVVAAPTACFYLASLGAEVIRLERPGGDLSWRTPPFVDSRGHDAETPGADVISLSHLKRSRGKRSVVVDFHTPHGRELAERILVGADVVVENFRPGVMDALGLGYEHLRERNPRLVYCAISGYGQTGARRDDQGMDLIIQAEAGLMARTGFPDGPPTKTGLTIGDQVPAAFAAMSILAALRRRDRDGVGALVDVAMYDVITAMLWDEPLEMYAERGWPVRMGNIDPRGAPVDGYRTADGWITMVTTSDAQWQALAVEMGRADLAVHVTLRERAANADAINDAVRTWAAAHSTDHVLEVLRRTGTPSGRVRDPLDAPGQTNVQQRELLEPLGARELPDRADRPEPSADRPESTSRFVGSRFPVAFDGQLPRAAPAERLGASTADVLAELGLGVEEIAELERRGIIGVTAG